MIVFRKRALPFPDGPSVKKTKVDELEPHNRSFLNMLSKEQ